MMFVEIKDLVEVKWEDCQPGDEVFIAGNLVLNTRKNKLEPTGGYGPHILLDAKEKKMFNPDLDREFSDRWPVVYKRKGNV